MYLYVYGQSWDSYFGKVTSYKLLVTFIPCNLVTVTFLKVTFILVTSYFYMLIAQLLSHILMIFMSWESEKEVYMCVFPQNSNSIVVPAPLNCRFKPYYSILELHAAVLCRYLQKLSTILTFAASLPVTK